MGAGRVQGVATGVTADCGTGEGQQTGEVPGVARPLSVGSSNVTLRRAGRDSSTSTPPFT